MPVSVHSIRVFNGFSSSSAAGPSSHLSSTQRVVGGFMQKPSATLTIASWRPKTPNHSKQGGSSTYAQRSTLRLPYTTRRVSVSPPPARLSTIVYSTEDPFAESDFDPIRTVMQYPHSPSSPRPRPSKSTSISPTRNDIPRQVANASNRDARSRLVAGILLHRVHAVGKPMRRSPMIRQGPREYVKSGLSTAITLEC